MTKTVIKESDKAVQVFSFGENDTQAQVRSLVDKESNCWFVAKDIAVALGYADFDQAVRKNCKKQKELKNIPVSEKGISKVVKDNAILIPESDVFRLILRSNLPAAEKFQDWICEDVLPALRKHGHYVFMSNQAHMLPQSYDYFPVELLAAAAEMTVVDFNHVLYRHGLQEMSVDAQGRMIFRLTKKGKEHGIAQQSYEENGVKMPPRILWRRKMLGVPAFGFGHEAMKRLPA